jgi:hypothetical protein
MNEATRAWIKVETEAAYARAVDGLLRSKDPRIVQAVFGDWERVEPLIVEAIANHLVGVLRERAEAKEIH